MFGIVSASGLHYDNEETSAAAAAEPIVQCLGEFREQVIHHFGAACAAAAPAAAAL